MIQAIAITLQQRHSVASHWCGQGIGHLLLAMLFIICRPFIEPAHAEPGQLEVGAKLAPSLEKHNEDRGSAVSAYKQGLSFGADLRYGLFDFLSLQAELLYATRGTDIQVGGVSQAGYYFSYLQLPLLVRSEWRIPSLTRDGDRPPLLGYVIAGPVGSLVLGAERETEARRQELGGSERNRFDFSVVAGLGVLWNIRPQWGASLEVRYDWGFIDSLEDTTAGLETKNRAILLTLGVSYTFNDRDGDRMYGSRDRCPREAEDRNGYKDSDGCADAEDDDDQDKVASSADQCHGPKEDLDGFKDEDGCPDPDNDGDGLVDSIDMCPNEAFLYNRAALDDTRGCPPKLRYVRVDEDSHRIVADPPLLFAKGIYDINPGMHPILNEVAELLTQYYPNMRVRIEGHADGFNKPKEGEPDPAEANQKQSEKRACSVFYYLTGTKEGKKKNPKCDFETGTKENPKIDINRLDVIGRGATQTISEQGTAAGAATHRRVEFVIIENPLPPIPEPPKKP
jgi:outer membrane protein OmpA-like peptidoglycan-associated protein